MEKHGFWGKRKNGESNMFLKKHGENLESDPKAKKRNKWLLRIGIGAAVLGACFTVLDKGTALRLMMNPNVKKIIWMPGWEFGADQDNEWVTSSCYGLGEIIFGDRTYGKDGKKIDGDITRRCMDTDMTAVFNERKQTVTFYNRDGKEQETIHMDGENISWIGWNIYFESGLIQVAMKNNEEKILNFRTNQVYDYNPYEPIEYQISDGYIRVRKNGLYGYLDINGNERIAPKYDRAGLFKNGLAKVQKADGSRVMIDKNDTEIYFEGLMNELYDYDDQLIRVKDGFVDHEGNYIVRLEEYGEDVSSQLLSHSRILVEGEEMICVLNADGTEVYHSGKNLDGGYIYDGFEKNQNGNVLLKYYMDPDNPEDSNGKYTILSQSGEPIVEYANRARGGSSMKYVDGNEWIAVFEDDRLVPTGIEGDLDVQVKLANNGTTSDLHPLVLMTQDSTHIISESGEKFVIEGAHDELEYYEGEGGEIFVAGTYRSPSGLYSSKKGQILPAGCRVEMASPQLLCVENTLLGKGWAYVVVLK